MTYVVYLAEYEPAGPFSVFMSGPWYFMDHYRFLCNESVWMVPGTWED